jgi:hypothetical protein
MTRHWREGHHRTTIYGTYWVEGHFVYRGDWGGATNIYSELLAQHRATESFTSNHVNPNAECPVCGALVFFYQNEFGSRVYFDELGPPWPKHPCTENFPARDPAGPVSIQHLSPVWRNKHEVAEIALYRTYAGQNPSLEFSTDYSQAPWPRVRVAKRLKFSGGVLLAVVIEKEGVVSEAFLKIKRLPRSVVAGTIAFLNGKNFAFFDLATMSVAEAKVQRVKNLSEVVRLLMD